MYHLIVRRQIRAAFAALSRGDAPFLLARMSADIHHSFPGDHALGGERSNRNEVGRWLDRLFRLVPGLVFQVDAIAADGPPWNTVVGVEWTDSGTLLDGSTYLNKGAHVLRLRWGKLTALHAYLHDPEQFTDALARLAAHGLAEASEPPILDRSDRIAGPRVGRSS